MTPRERSQMQERLVTERRQRVNLAIAQLRIDRRKQERRLTSSLVSWKARFDAAKAAA